MKKYKKGYQQGVFDMFHVGHLNAINAAKELCDFLVVGVNADILVEQYKNKKPVIDQESRKEIIKNLKAVDEAVIANTLDKEVQLSKIGFDVIFIGDDWKGNPRWNQTEKDLAKYNVDVVYLPRTEGISSTDLRIVENKKIND